MVWLSWSPIGLLTLSRFEDRLLQNAGRAFFFGPFLSVPILPCCMARHPVIPIFLLPLRIMEGREEGAFLHTFLSLAGSCQVTCIR